MKDVGELSMQIERFEALLRSAVPELPRLILASESPHPPNGAPPRHDVEEEGRTGGSMPPTVSAGVLEERGLVLMSRP